MKPLHVLGFLATCLAGALGQECDSVAAMSCARKIQQPTSSSDSVDCEAFMVVVECLKPHKESCKSDTSFQSIMASIDTLKTLCGGDGGCNLVGISACQSKMEQQSDPSPGSINCTVFKEAYACLLPYLESCKTNPSFQAAKSALDAVAPFCGGESSGCNPQKCMTDAGVDPTDPTPPNCDAVMAVQTCLQGQSSACEGNSLYTIATTSLQQHSTMCAGGTIAPGSCNYQQVESCVSAAGGVPSTGSKLLCGSEVNVEKCIEQYKDICKDDAGFKILQGTLQSLTDLCKKQCNFQECNIDFTFPSGVPSKMDYDSGCSAAKNAIQCLEPKLKSCPNMQMGRLTDGVKMFCADSGVKEGLETHKNCLESSKLNINCGKFLAPPMSGMNMTEETQDQECMRMEKYSMCAKGAVSECENEAVGMFAAETARKVITLKSKREGGIDCPTGAGAALLPSIFLLLFTTVLAVTRVC